VRRVADELEGGKLVLGSQSLVAGIPGEGDLSLEEIRLWLADPQNHQPLDFVLPLGLREMADQVQIPADNPLTRAKIELGRQLFFDVRLVPGERSCECAACHPPGLCYAFGNVFPPDRFPHVRTVPPIMNRILGREHFWDGRAASLEAQAIGPLTNPHEMGSTEEQCVATLRSIEGYRVQFDRIFGGVTIDGFCKAIASFERVLVTRPSAWDYARELRRWDASDRAGWSANDQTRFDELLRAASRQPMPEAALRGEELFFSDRTHCGECHSGPNLSDERYHNIGIGMDRADPDPGRFAVTGDMADFGAFRTPSLRNAAQTLPYMHDGRFFSLEEVIDWYDAGGHAKMQLSPRLRPLGLTQDEKRDLVAFLQACSSAMPVAERGRLPSR
jgi:cytochrome c peroxidase